MAGRAAKSCRPKISVLPPRAWRPDKTVAVVLYFGQPVLKPGVRVAFKKNRVVG